VVRVFPPETEEPLFSTTKETKGHKGKKAKKHPLCTFVTLRGKGFPTRNGRASKSKLRPLILANTCTCMHTCPGRKYRGVQVSSRIFKRLAWIGGDTCASLTQPVRDCVAHVRVSASQIKFGVNYVFMRFD